MIVCKSMINKIEKRLCLVFTGMISVFLAKSCEGDRKTQCTAEKESGGSEEVDDLRLFCLLHVLIRSIPPYTKPPELPSLRSFHTDKTLCIFPRNGSQRPTQEYFAFVLALTLTLPVILPSF
jgi:hypothetical protein